MKVKKLMERLGSYLDADIGIQMEEASSIRKLLKELKKKERSLRQKLDALDPKVAPEEREELQTKLDVIYAQRKKGLVRVKELKKSMKQ